MVALTNLSRVCIAVPGVPNWWPLKPAGASLSYELDIAAEINADRDVIMSVVAQAAPSGAGELVISDLRVRDDVLTLTTAGGQPTRIYTIKFTVQMFDGARPVFTIYQGVPPGLRGYSIQVSPSPDFGDPVTWIFIAPYIGVPVPLLGGF